MKKDSLTVAMTCHNRRQLTLRAIGQVMRQGVSDIVVVDDGSTDGTADAVADAFPGVRLLHGDGELYWAGGMALATHSILMSSEAVLWLNDDVSLDTNALDRLLAASQLVGKFAIVVGALRGTDYQDQVTYSGLNRAASWRRLNFRPVTPGAVPLAVDTFNGNLVLVPAGVIDLVGPIDRSLRHRMADLDYGLRAKAKGVEIMLAPGTFGECDRNVLQGTWGDGNLSLRARWALFVSLKGFEPKAYKIFAKRHGGIGALVML
jgi:GT2 family glycosyltransferase